MNYISSDKLTAAQAKSLSDSYPSDEYLKEELTNVYYLINKATLDGQYVCGLGKLSLKTKDILKTDVYQVSALDHRYPELDVEIKWS